MDEISNITNYFDELDKKKQPVNSLGQPVQSRIDNMTVNNAPANVGALDAYVQSQMQPQQQQYGYFDAFMKGAKAQAAGAVGGQADFVSGMLGTDGAVGDYFQNVAQNNQRKTNYGLKDVLANPLQYITDPNGLTYDVGGGVGSSTVLGLEGAAIMAALPAGVTAGITGAIGTGAARLGLPWVANALKSPAGKMLIGNVLKTPVEAMSEGGNTYREMTRNEDGTYNQNADLAAARTAMYTDAGLNAALLTFTNSLESAGLGGLINASGGKGKVLNVLKGVIGDFLQNGYEEGAQQGIQNYATGKGTARQILDPTQWTPEQWDESFVGAITGAVQGGGMTAGGMAANKLLGVPQQEQQPTQQPTSPVESVVNNEGMQNTQEENNAPINEASLVTNDLTDDYLNSLIQGDTGVEQLTKQRDNFLNLFNSRFGEAPASLRIKDRRTAQPKQDTGYIANRTDGELENMLRRMKDLPNGHKVKQAVLAEMNKRGIVSGDNFATGANIVPYGSNKRELANVGAEGKQKPGGALSKQTQWSELEHRLAEHFKGNPESLKVAIANKIRQLGEDAKNGVITQEQFNNATRVLNNAYDTILPYVQNDNVIINQGKYYHSEPKPKDMAVINDAIAPVVNGELTTVEDKPLSTVGDRNIDNREGGSPAAQNNGVGPARVTPTRRLEGKQILPEHKEEYAGTNVITNMVERRRQTKGNKGASDIVTTEHGMKTRDGQYRGAGIQDAEIVDEYLDKAKGENDIQAIASADRTKLQPGATQRKAGDVNNENNETTNNNNENSKPEKAGNQEGKTSKGGQDETNQVENKEYTREEVEDYIVAKINEEGKNKLYDNGIYMDIPYGIVESLTTQLHYVQQQDPRDYTYWYDYVLKKEMLNAIKNGNKARLHLKRYKGSPHLYGDIYAADYRANISVEQLMDVSLVLNKEQEAKAEAGVKFTLNDKQKGIEIKFPSKPSADVLSKLRAAKFRWHDTKKVWYAKQSNSAAMEVAKELGYKPSENVKPFDNIIKEDKFEEAVKALTSKRIEELKANDAYGLSQKEKDELIKELTREMQQDFNDSKGDIQNAVDEFLKQYNTKNKVSVDLEKVKQAKKELENKTKVLIDDFKERDFASEKAVRELEKEANDKLAEYEDEALKDKILNKKTIEDIIKKAEDELNEVIKTKLQEAKAKEVPDYKVQLGAAKKTKLYGPNSKLAEYETDTRRYTVTEKSGSFTVEVADKSNDIVSNNVTIVHDMTPIQTEKFNSLEEAEKFITEQSQKPELPIFKEGIGDAKYVDTSNLVGDYTDKVIYKTDKKRFVIKIKEQGYPYFLDVYNKGDRKGAWNWTDEGTGGYRDIDILKSTIEELAKDTGEVVESKVDTTTKGDNENVTNSEGLSAVPEGNRGSGENAVEETGGNSRPENSSVPTTVQGGTGKTAGGKSSTGGQGLPSSVETPSNAGSTSKGSSNSGTVREELTPAQKEGAPASEHAGHNYTITPSGDKKNNSFEPKKKFRINVDALKLLHKLETEGRMATPAEQKKLAQYVGWGGLADAFDTYGAERKGWKKECDELKELVKSGVITQQEYNSMRESTLTAFYTPVGVIQSIWDIMDRMGFKGGRVLEPSMATGKFFGLMPESMRSNSSLNGVEIDTVTGKIAKQLYQGANIKIDGFEKVQYPENYFDLIISNVPFSDNIRPNDKKYNKDRYVIHNYFFKKAMALTRPGGIVCFITSTETMNGDKQSLELRKALSKEADFIGAIRLPDNTFSKDANTKTATDLIILQKREGQEPGENHHEWIETQDSKVAAYQPIATNSYYKKNKKMQIGTDAQGGRWGSYTSSGVIGKAEDGRTNLYIDVEKEIKKRVKYFPENIYQERKQEYNSAEATQEYLKPENIKFGNFVANDKGIICQEDVEGNKIPLSDRVQKRASAYVPLRDTVKKLLSIQLDKDTTEQQIKDVQNKLNKLYDDFVAKYGPLNASANKALSDDIDYGLICSIEEYRPEKSEGKGKNKIIKEPEYVGKRAIFTERTINAYTVPDKVDSSSDALSLSLVQKDGVDIKYMSELTGKQENEIVKELEGKIYFDPNKDTYVPADEYLSGNVREKLEQAEIAQQYDKKYEGNIKALEKVIPKDLKTSDIRVELGSNWVPASDYKDFVAHMLQTRPQNINLAYNSVSGWSVGDGVVGEWHNPQNEKTWASATEDKNGNRINSYTFLELLPYIMNKAKLPRIYNGSGENKVDSPSGKLALQGLVDRISKEFKDWIWSNQDRESRLLDYYNRTYNSIVPRKYDGSHLDFKAWKSILAPEFRDNQKDGIWRIMQGNTLLAHCVGAGKTWTMQAAAMEMKRLGIANKSMFVIPPHMLKQFENEFRQIAPTAKLLVIDSETLPDVPSKKDKKYSEKLAVRNALLSRIATENWDGIIIAHNLFTRIPMTAEANRTFIQEQLDELEIALRIASENRDESISVKKLEGKKKSLESKLEELLNADNKDLGMPFEQLGIDQLFVDEADLYKNLEFSTAMGNIQGLSNSASQRSQDMYIKTRWLSAMRSGKGVCFATGTPVSNSLAEEFTMLRYLSYDKLREMGLNNFDAWASVFTKTKEVAEVNPSGNGFRMVKRLEFTNGGDLMRLFRSVADVIKKEQLEKYGVKLPVLKNNQRTVIQVDEDPIYRDFLENEIWPRVEAIHGGGVDHTEDNMLKVTIEQRLASLDMRLVKSDTSAAEAGGKVKKLAEHAYKKYVETNDIKGTQVIFCDLSTPKGLSNKESENEVDEVEDKLNFNVYNDIKKQLIKQGIKPEEIAFIHDAGTDKDKKQELFDKVVSGEIRIIIGSTSKMGAGTNFQKRLVALHHLDAPWRPRDIEQREGRLIRQGNMNDEVEIFTYVTQGSFDEIMWDKIKKKSKTISDAMSDDFSIRDFDDIGGAETLSYAAVQAVASRNPLLAEKTQIDADVAKYEAMKAAYEQTKRNNERDIYTNIPKDIASYEANIDNANKDIEQRENVSGDKFKIKLLGRTYTDRKTAVEKLEKLRSDFNNDDWLKVGEYAGFDIMLKGKGDYVDAAIRNNDFYYVNTTSLIGIDNTVKDAPEKQIKSAQMKIAEKQKTLAVLKEDIKKPFAEQAKLDEVLQKQAEINAAIERDTDTNQNKNGQGMDQGKYVVDEETGELIEAPKGKASIGRQDVEKRAYAEIETEIKEAFPGGKVQLTSNGPVITLPNGNSFIYSIKDNILVDAKQQKKADAAHGTSGGAIQGYIARMTMPGVNAMLVVSRKSQKGTAFHEAMHAAIMWGLTEKESNSLYNYYRKQAQKQGRDVEEVVADAYRDWVLARQKNRGTLFGKLWQKVKDFATRIKALFDKGAEVQRIMQDVESGKVYERNNTNNTTSKIKFAANSLKTVDDVRKKYEGTDQWLKAPNGKRTNLSEQQWLQVRTDSFKNWFGDWKNQDFPKDFLDKKGEPLILYHGSKNYGFSIFDKSKNHGLIYATPQGYNAQTYAHNARVRNKVAKYESDNGNIDKLIQNAKELLGVDFEVLTDEKAAELRNVFAKKAEKIRDKWAKIDYENDIPYVDNFDNDNNEHLESFKAHFDVINAAEFITENNDSEDMAEYYSQQEYQNLFEKRDKLRDYWRKHTELYTEKNKPFRDFLFSYEFGDFIIYADGYYRKLLSPESSLISGYGDGEYNIVKADALRESLDEQGKYGTYSLFGKAGDNPLIIDGDNAWWQNIKVDVMGDKHYSTDEIAKWAENNGYTSVVIKNIIDPAIDYGTNQALDDYIFFNENEVKSATDNNGDFSINNNDIRYSVAQPVSVGDVFSNTEEDKSIYEQVKAKGAKGWLGEKAKQLYVDWIDKNDSLHGLDEAFAMSKGLKELKPDKSIYNRVQTLASNVAGEAGALIDGTDDHINNISDKLKLEGKNRLHLVSMRKVLETIDAKKMDKLAPEFLQQNGFKNWVDAFGGYLGSRRLLEMSRLAKEAGEEYTLPKGITEQQLKEYVAKAPAEFKTAANMYYLINDNLLKLMENAGLISAELHNTLNTKYKEYCPLMRDFSDTAAADTFIDGITNGGKGIANVSSMLKKISIEGSKRGVFNPLESTVKAIAVAANRCERNRVCQMAVDMVDDANGALDSVIYKVYGDKADAKNMIFTVMRNGKKEAYQVAKEHEELYLPIVSYNEAGANLVFGLARSAANMLRTGATMSPSFCIRNLIRDTIFAGISSKNGFIPMVDSIRGMYALWKNPKARAEFEAAGVTAFNFYSHKEETYDDLLRMNGSKQFKWYKPSDVWEAITKYPVMASEFIESSTRMGEFMRAREKDASLEEAARAARELTLDFSRSGVRGQQYNQYVPFFNACLQGGDKMYRLLRDDFIGTSVKLAEYIIIPSMLLWALNHDEDWYKELDPGVKNSNWCLPGGIRIPKPQEAGVTFGSGIEAVLDYAFNKDKKAISNWAAEVRDLMAPNYIPTLFLPILEWQANYSFFRQGPLVSKKLQKLPSEQQFSNTTSTGAKAIGRFTGLSPVKIDNTIRGYTGTMGMFLWQTGDFLEDRNSPEKRLGEYQFVRDFNVTDSVRNRYVNEFYELLDAANKQHAGYGIKGKPAKDVQEITKYNKVISGLNKDIQNITNNKVISPARKRELIDNKKQRIKQVARRAVEKYGAKYL